MHKKELLELQTKRGAKTDATSTINIVTIDVVLSECRKHIEENTEQYKRLNTLEKKEKIKQLIVDYVMAKKPLVEGYMDGSNKPDTLKLVDKLIEDITDYGILTKAMINEDIYEIRGNGKEIKVEVKGKIKDLTDDDGRVVSFSSPEQQQTIMRKLLGDTRLTPKDALVNARTIEGYRIAAVHSSVMSPDPNDPTGEVYDSFVLRKFHKKKMTLAEIVKNYNTMSDNMARLLSLCTAGGLTFFTVGPTASGKTTTNNAILQSVPATTRTVLIQNPSEIDLRFKDSVGRVYNDVLHLEATEMENPTEKDPTMKNLMDHTLRLSPTFVVFGEIRSNDEFKQCMKIMQAGHPINTTFHSESSIGAIRRFQNAYLDGSNQPSHLALGSIVELVNLIIVQKIMRDGTRKIIQISEIVGVNKDDKDVPEVNDLYVFDINGEPDYDEAGNVVRINGKHRRVGKLSERTIRKLQLEGVASSRYDFLTREVNRNEEETYTGEDIERYGMNRRSAQ